MKTQFSIALDPDVHAWVKDQASRQRVSISTYINTHFASLLPPATAQPDAPAKPPARRARRRA